MMNALRLMVLAALLLPGTAAAECQGLTVNYNGNSNTLTDDAPFTQGVAVINATVQVDTCTGSQAYLYVNKPFFNNPRPEGIIEVKYAGNTLIGSDKGTTPVQVAPIAPGQPVTLQLAYRKDQPGSPAAGNYNFTLPLSLRTAGSVQDVSIYNTQTTVSVSKVTHLRVASSAITKYENGSDSTDVDFGELRTDAVRSFYVNVRSTSAYSLSLSSDNNYNLLGNGGGSDAEKTVAYSLQADGQRLTPAGQVINLPNIGTNTDINGRMHTFNVTLGNASNKHAGNYADQLIITSSSL